MSWRWLAVVSRTLENVENDNDGTPQLSGFVETPTIPALPATSSVNAKLLLVDEVVREKLKLIACWTRPLEMFTVIGMASEEPSVLPPSAGRTFACSLSLRRYWTCAVRLTRSALPETCRQVMGALLHGMPASRNSGLP